MAKLSNWELLEIVYRRDDYDELAVDAAQSEFDSRNLTKEQLNQARIIVLDRAVDRQNEKEKALQIEAAMQEFGKEAVDTLHPLKQKSTRKIIRLICGYLLLVAILQIYQNWYRLRYLVNIRSVDDLYALEPVILITLVLIIIYLLWTHRLTGWIMMTSYLVFVCISWIIKVALYIDLQQSNLMELSDIFRPSFDSGFLLFGLTTIALLIFFNTNRIKEFFNISQNTQIKTMVGATLFSLFLLVALSIY